MRERTRRPPALGCALASRIQAAMTVAHVTKFLFACVSWLVLALPMPAAAADPCPLLRAQAGSPVVATRIAAAACEEHQLWYRPFIDLDGRHAGSHVREAETGLLANGQPAWRRGQGGRAAGRERVCHDGWDSVVGWYLKK